MKSKNIIISICIGVLVLLLIIGFIVTKNVKKNDDSKIDHQKTKFEEEYNIKNEKYSNDNNEFNYSADIYSSKDNKELTCITITFYDKDKNVVLSYNEDINLNVDSDSPYKVNVNYPKNIDVTKVEYDLCE